MKKVLLGLVVSASVLSSATLTSYLVHNDGPKKASSSPSLFALFERNGAQEKAEKKEISSTIISPSFSIGPEFSFQSKGSVTYKNIVDLASVSKEENLVEYVANSSLDYSDLSKAFIEIKNVTVRVTDAYDSNIYFEVNATENAALNQVPFEQMGGGVNNLFYSVTVGGYTVANNSDYAPLENCAVAWKQSFYNAETYPDGSKGSFLPCGFKFDLATNEVRLDLGTANNPKTEDPHNYLLWDLDDPTDAYPDFEGFTTGEVYISITTSEGGDLAIYKIGNDVFDGSISLFEKNTGNLLAGGFDFGAMFPGAKGVAYPLPIIKGNTPIDLEIKKGENTVQKGVVDSFTPSEEGDYSLIYSSKNAFGALLKKEGDFHVNEKQTPLVDNSNIQKITAKLFSSFEIPTFSYSGGNGPLSKEVSLFLDGVRKKVIEGQKISIEQKAKVASLEVKVRDSLGQEGLFYYPISVDNNVLVFSLTDGMEKTYVSKGSSFVVPSFSAIDYSKEDVSETNVDVFIRRGRSTYYEAGQVIKNVQSDFELSYIHDDEVLGKVSVIVIDSNFENNTSNLLPFYADSQGIDKATSSQFGTYFRFKEKDVEIRHPSLLSSSSFTLSWVYVPSLSHFDEMKIELSSIGGKSLELQIKELGEKPTLFLNGHRIYAVPTIQELTYSDQDGLGFDGVKGYKYTLIFEGSTGSFYMGNNALLAKASSFSDGSSFHPFKRSALQLKLSIPDAQVGDVFFLNQVSNQQFTSQVLAFGDSRGPALGFDGSFSNRVYKKGEIADIPMAYAYDAISSYANVSMRIVDPRGNLLLNASRPMGLSLPLDQYGGYVVTYSCRDGNGKQATYSYRLVVIDEVAPTIVVKGNYEDSYSEKIFVHDAFAKDEADGDVPVYAWIRYQNGERWSVSLNQENVLREKGVCTLIYFASDAAGNVATVECPFMSR